MPQASPEPESCAVTAVLVQVYTVDIGVAVGQSCMLLAAGAKGHRFMLEHATGEPQRFRVKHLRSGCLCGEGPLCWEVSLYAWLLWGMSIIVLCHPMPA